MSQFDFMLFSGGYLPEFVCHAKKYTKEEVVELCKGEHGDDFQQDRRFREPLESDITEAYVRYYVKCPEWCGYEADEGCYTYCDEGVRGSFPVWVIDYEKLVR